MKKILDETQQHFKHFESKHKSNDDDVLFFFGDLNFRTSLSQDETFKLIKEKRYDRILKFDEFLSSKDKSFLFNLFQEGNIEFQPTYKFEIGQNLYDKNRIPAYCDRILCKSN